jgi:hypothetical protein
MYDLEKAKKMIEVLKISESLEKVIEALKTSESLEKVIDFNPVSYYIWKDNKIKTVNMMEWSMHNLQGGNIIKQSRIDGFFISTALLPFEHCGGVFETMIFDQREMADNMIDSRMKRCNTVEEAIKDHEHMKKIVSRYLKQQKKTPHE